MEFDETNGRTTDFGFIWGRVMVERKEGLEEWGQIIELRTPKQRMQIEVMADDTLLVRVVPPEDLEGAYGELLGD